MAFLQPQAPANGQVLKFVAGRPITSDHARTFIRKRQYFEAIAIWASPV